MCLEMLQEIKESKVSEKGKMGSGNDMCMVILRHWTIIGTCTVSSFL